MKGEVVQIPRVSGIGIKRVCFDSRKPAAMSRRMDICTIFDFHGFRQALDQPPELALYVVFRFHSSTIEDWVERHLWREVVLLKIVGLFLELLERIDAAFLESIFTRAYEAFRTVPIEVRNRIERRIKAVFVITQIATVAGNDGVAVFGFTAVFTLLNLNLATEQFSGVAIVRNSPRQVFYCPLSCAFEALMVVACSCGNPLRSAPRLQEMR